MSDCEITPAAQRDLLEIARYTIKSWGVEQADRYEAALTELFAAIATGEARARSFLEHRPELRVSRCEHHYVFFLERQNARPFVLAVFHENMDLMTRLRDRLEPESHE